MSDNINPGCSQSKSNKKAVVVRWIWSDEMTTEFLNILKTYKTEKELGKGIKWDSDKLILFEHVRKQ